MAGLAGAQLLVALDFSIMYVALPDIGAALRFSPVALQWIVSAYAIFFAGFLVLGGQLADAVGAGRMFVVAQALFAVSSLGAGFAGSAAPVIAARVGQGVAAALLVPATLGVLGASYPAGPQRNRAVSVWGTTGAVGLALGVLAGGALVALASWRWVFWVNLPVVAVCLVAAGPALRRVRPVRRVRVAVVGTLAASAAVVAVVAACTELARAHPRPLLVGAGFAVAALAGAVFGVHQRGDRPLVPRGLLAVRTLRTACVVAALYMASFGVEFYLVTLYLQDVRGYRPLAAGCAFLPLAGAIVVGNTLAGRYAGRWPLRRLLAVAYAVGGVGLVVLAVAVHAHAGYVAGLLPGLLLSGVGQGTAFTALFVTGTRDLPPDRAGTGSALVTTAQYTGGSLGLALVVLLHGERPGTADFVHALALTAAVALAAVPVALLLLSPARRATTDTRTTIGAGR
ncbi:MFS transporter [Actinocatenispora rupis]|uniref:MFS transporter n=1 Tax=Actinocatenispora rupis TaxID=519421 RepID=A0A8J3J065_9ACTN|nr:MFS transporter [Actinocatenispora rupis]